MLRSVKQLLWTAGIIIGCQSAFGFALLGPVPGTGVGIPDSFQTPALFYGVGGLTTAGGIVSVLGGYAASPAISAVLDGGLIGVQPSSDMGTPKNIAEGYRRNTPVMYYSFDASFLEFFGPDGAAEVDKAMNMYNSLAPVSSYSPDLSEFPTESRRVNVRAATSSLLDIKSATMGMMTEQLGFFQPVRWVWALHDRVHLTGAGIPPCPGGMDYTVYKRNFDIVPSSVTNYQSSSYVNGQLYSYFIFDFCTGTTLADAIEFPVDPLGTPYSAVADYASAWYTGLAPGTFYTSLTRDDIGGLRYLIRQTNFAYETAGARVIEFVTNAAPQALQTFDLNVFAAQALTNSGATLATLYPGLVVTSDTNFIGITILTNITQTLVSSPYDPAGLLPSHPIFTTNFSTNFFSFFQHTFANLVTNSFSTFGLVGTATINLVNTQPYAPAGTLPTTNIDITTEFVPGVFGDFFIIPTNLCGAEILSNLITTVTITTNPPTAITPVAPGVVGPAITFVPGSVTFSTNHVVVFLPVTCPVNPPGTFGGMEQVRFIRRDYDSLINRVWDPVTNDYTLYELTNYAALPRHMQRAIPKPDFLFSAVDLGGTTGFTYSNTVAGATESLAIGITGLTKFDAVKTINYDETVRPGNLAGPGTITTPLVIPTLMIYNKLGPEYFNTTLGFATNAFISEVDQSPFLALSWASFDGSTNAPEVYPNGTSLAELESLLTGPSPVTVQLPPANVGANYSAEFAAQGGQPPYTWSLAPGSPGLPAGLTLTPDGQITGAPTGPAAIYDFTVRVTDSSGAIKDLPYTITVF